METESLLRTQKNSKLALHGLFRLSTVLQREELEKKATFAGVTMGLLTAMTGVGVLNFPLAMENLGFGLGLISIIFFGSVVLYISRVYDEGLSLADRLVLTRNLDIRQVKSLVDYAYVAYGQKGRIIAITAALTQLLGTCACILILIGNYGDMMLSSKSFFSSYRYIMILVLPAAIASGFLKTVTMFEKISLFSTVTSLSLPLIMGLLSTHQIYTSGGRFPENVHFIRELPDTSTKSIISYIISITGSLTSIIYGYNFMVCLPTLRADMKEPETIKKAATINVLIGGSLYIFASMSTYFAYNTISHEYVDLLLSKRQEFLIYPTGRVQLVNSLSTPGVALACCITLSLILTYPLLLNVAIQMIQQSLFSEKIQEFGSVKNISLRLSTVLFTVLVALFIPYFEQTVAFLGASVLCIINVLLPILCLRRLSGTWGVTKVKRFVNVGLFAFGCYILVVGTYDACVGFVTSFTDQNKPPVNALTQFGLKLYPRV